MAVGPDRLLPVTLTVCGLFGALLLIVSIAEIAPVSGAFGVNVIVMLQLELGATGVVHPVAEKSVGFAAAGVCIVNVSG